MKRQFGVVAYLFLPIGAATADMATFSASAGTRAATAVFTTSGSSLTVDLLNTSTNDTLVPVDILTAVFFSLPTGVSLTRVSATLNGNVVHFGSDGGGNVSGEWAYKTGVNGPLGATAGISSSGLDDMFGPYDRFGTANLQGPASPDGLQYGITSAVDNMTTGNAKVTGGQALIKNSVRFTFGFTGNFDPHAISDVSFQYGTSMSEPNVPYLQVVPAPDSTWLGLVGASGLLLGRRRMA